MKKTAMDFITTHNSSSNKSNNKTENNNNNKTPKVHENSELITALAKERDDLKATVQCLSMNCIAYEKQIGAHKDKLLLNAQMHTNRVKALEVKEQTLTKRCQEMGALTELHRLATLKHEQTNKKLSQDLQSMTTVQLEAEKRHRAAVKQMQAAHESNVQALKSMHQQHVSGRLQQAEKLLRAAPLLADSEHILGSLKSSAEVLQLAHEGGGVDSMRECLGEVALVLHDLHGQLQGRHRLASEWQKRVEDLF